MDLYTSCDRIKLHCVPHAVPGKQRSSLLTRSACVVQVQLLQYCIAISRLLPDPNHGAIDD